MKNKHQIEIDSQIFIPNVDPEELFVKSKLAKYLNPNEYTILNDIMLPSDNGNTKNSQIDHIVISRYGIFCIETKSDAGMISGDSHGKTWIKDLYGKQYQMYSPIRQNYGHVKALEKTIGAKRLRTDIISLVILPSAEKTLIIGADGVGNDCYAIEKIESYKPQIYSSVECHEFIDRINGANILDKPTRTEHKREVDSLIADSILK